MKETNTKQPDNFEWSDIETSSEEDSDDPDVDAVDEKPVMYFHVTACGPGGIADLAGNFARNIYKAVKRHGKRPPEAYMSYPTDWEKCKLSDKGIMSKKPGGDPYYIQIQNLKKIIKPSESKNYDPN